MYKWKTAAVLPTAAVTNPFSVIYTVNYSIDTRKSKGGENYAGS